jgi:EmrB/QacA subfamily drug resistance transporter
VNEQANWNPGATAVNPNHQKRWWALAVITAAQLMMVLDGTIVNIALPSMQSDLSISDADRHWAITAYALAFGGLLLLGGRISGIVGHHRTFLFSLVGFAAASALGGAASDASLLFWARALQGLFAAAMAPAALSLLTMSFRDPRELGRAFAVFGAVSAAGAGVGLLAGGLLTEYLSWRWCLWVNVPIVGIALLGLPLVVRDTPATRTDRLDIPGALLSAGGVAALVYGFSQAESRGWTDPLVCGLLLGGAASLALFVLVESRVSNPLLPLRVFLHRARGGAFLVSGMMMAALFGCFLFLSYYAQTVLGYTPVQAGLTIMVLVVGSLIGSLLIAGRLLIRVGAKTLIVPGLLAMAAGLFILSRLTPDSTHILTLNLVPAQLLIGLGLGSALTAATSLAMSELNPADTGTAAATFNAAQQIGGALGIALFNTVVTTAAATYLSSNNGDPVGTTAATVEGFGLGLLVSMAIMLVAAGAAAIIIESHSAISGD